MCFSDRLIGSDDKVCDIDCVSEARLIGLTFSVGRLLHSVAHALLAAAEPDKSDLRTRLCIQGVAEKYSTTENAIYQ